MSLPNTKDSLHKYIMVYKMQSILAYYMTIVQGLNEECIYCAVQKKVKLPTSIELLPRLYLKF